MFALSRQVQIACDSPPERHGPAAGVAAPRFEDDETTLDQLKARIAKTADFLRSVDGWPSMPAVRDRLPVGPNKMQMAAPTISFISRFRISIST
jgi:hypothetical protein